MTCVLALYRAQEDRKNRFPTAIVTLNTVQDELGWAQIKGVGHMKNFTWISLKFCHLWSKNEWVFRFTYPSPCAEESLCNKGLNILKISKIYFRVFDFFHNSKVMTPVYRIREGNITFLYFDQIPVKEIFTKKHF